MEHPRAAINGGPAAAGQPTIAALFAVFARYANTTFGGGSATVATLRKHILERHAWISEQQFELSFALSRLTPGTNLLAFCTAVGWMTRRWLGALACLVASSLPCSIIAVVFTHFFEQLEGHRIFQAALRGALAAAVAIVINTAWVLARPYVKVTTRKALVFAPAAIALVRFVGLSPFQTLLLAAAVGLAWPAQESKP